MRKGMLSSLGLISLLATGLSSVGLANDPAARSQIATAESRAQAEQRALATPVKLLSNEDRRLIGEMNRRRRWAVPDAIKNRGPGERAHRRWRKRRSSGITARKRAA